MSTTKLFIGTTVRDQRVHAKYMMGLLQVSKDFGNDVQISLHMGGHLPRARDSLTAIFLESGCTHALFVDSDIGWTPADVHALLESEKDIISGCYSKRADKPEIPARLTGARDGKEGELWEAEYVPAGFLLITRAVMERMCGAYLKLQYRTPEGLRTALWGETFGVGAYNNMSSYSGEDIAFCERARAIGLQIWLHQGVLLPHVGEHTFMPIAPGQTPKP